MKQAGYTGLLTFIYLLHRKIHFQDKHKKHYNHHVVY